MAYCIFVIDDDVWMQKKLKHLLSINPDHQVKIFDNPEQLLSSLIEKPDLICVDLMLPNINGEELIVQILETNPNQDILVISGQESISVAVELMKKGVKDYIPKNQNLKEYLWKAVERIKENKRLKDKIQKLESKIKNLDIPELSGTSKEIQRIKSHIHKVKRANITVVITGETGTGKELVAKAIHNHQSKFKGEFVAVNMSAIPDKLIESELFGYEKGAFTGADKQKKGLFEIAKNGTLFLDEIAELDISLQAKLLRALQEKEIRRIGGSKPIPIETRLIFATHKDLEQEIENGNFREDLYYRILGFPIHLPPLRERSSDIYLLAKEFAEKFSKENNQITPKLTRGAKQKLLSHYYPGNIRELKSIMELACVLSSNQEITEEDISFSSKKPKISFAQQGKTLREYTNLIIQESLEKHHYDVKKVAQLLDIGVSTIYNLAKKDQIKIKP